MDDIERIDWWTKEVEDEKQKIIGNYVEKRMRNHNLPYGMAYLNKLASVEQKAERYYRNKYGSKR